MNGDNHDRQTWQDPDVPEYFNGTTLLLDRHLHALSEKRAIVCDDLELTYSALKHAVCRTAHGLRDAGLRPDERLLMFGTDSIEFVVVWLAAIRCGVVPVTVSDRYKAPLLEYFLQHTAAKGLFVDEEQLDKLADIAGALPPSLDQVIVRPSRGNELAARPAFPDVIVRTYAELVRGKSSSFEPQPRHKNDLTYFFYSGGTTGRPKGIVHTSVDFYLIPERHGRFLDYQPSETVHATSKKYFTHGLWPGVLMPLYWGSTAVMTRAAQTGASVLSLVEDQNVTRVITVPAVIRELVAAAKQSTEARRQMSTVTVLCCASEKLPPSLCDEFFDLFELEILDAIGSAEVTYQWIANRPADYKRASLGKPIFGYDIKLLDENGAAISTPHTQGEAWIKSETGLLFYWRDFQKTREATNGLWFKTGDKLMFDEDGFYWFVGRGDDLFKIAGLWVSPIEVEAEIAKHPSVAECAVVAGENDQGKTFVRAFVVPRDDAVSRSSLEEEIRSAVKQIGGYKVPKQIEFVSELPRTELRKINRRLLREM